MSLNRITLLGTALLFTAVPLTWLEMALDSAPGRATHRLVGWMIIAFLVVVRLSWRFRFLVELGPESFVIAGPFGRREFRYDQVRGAVCYGGSRHIHFKVGRGIAPLWWIDVDPECRLLEELEVHGVAVKRPHLAVST